MTHRVILESENGRRLITVDNVGLPVQVARPLSQSLIDALNRAPVLARGGWPQDTYVPSGREVEGGALAGTHAEDRAAPRRQTIAMPAL